MKRKQFCRQAYLRPAIEITEIQTDLLIVVASGNHKDADFGGSTGDAKQGWFDEEEDEDIVPNSKGDYQLWDK